VVLSRRVPVLLLGALVVVVVLGMIGVLGAVPGNAANDRTVAKARSSTTLTVMTKTREATVVDLGPRGPSHGDMRVVNAPVYDESGTKRIGRVDFFCVTTDPADEPNEKAHMVECTVTYTLPGGEISVQGVNALPKLSGPPPKGVNAITGGTGKYAGVRGEERFETRGNKVIITFHFIG
jgi:hypothetical protein